jgi:putative peptidoglycan lipid II flippase
VTVARLARAATLVAIFGIFSRLLGLVRETVLAAVYGISGATDAFVNALFVVNAIAAILLYTLVTLVIPAFHSESERAGIDSAWRLVAAIAGWAGIGLIALSSFVALFPEIPAAAFGLDAERAATAEMLIRIMAPALALQGFSAIFTALLQIHGRFGVPAAVGVAFNLGIVVGVLIGQGSIGIEAAGWGVSVGALFQVLLQLPQFLRLVRRDQVRLSLRHPRLGSVGMLALPVVGASAVQQINNFTDKLFASTLEEGRVAALSFANSLGSAPRTALLLPLMVPLFPLVARLVAEKRDDDALSAVHRVAGLLGLVAVPVTLFVALYSQEIAQLAYGRNKCDAECVTQIGAPLTWYGVAIWANFMGVFLNRTLSAANQQRRILLATVVTVVLTIALDIALLGPMEQAGLALASAIAVYVNVGQYLVYLRRRFPALGVRMLARQQLRLAACGGVGVLAILGADQLLPTGNQTSWHLAGLLLIKAAIGAGAYLAAIRLVAPRELAEARNSLGALARRRRPA